MTRFVLVLVQLRSEHNLMSEDTLHILDSYSNKTEVTSVKLVLFKWEKLFDILT